FCLPESVYQTVLKSSNTPRIMSLAPIHLLNSIKHSKIPYLFWLAVLLLCALPAVTIAQEVEVTEQDTVVAAAPTWPEDSLGRRTPRGTISGFIKAVADGDYTRAAFYLNLASPNDTIQDGAAMAQALQRM